MTNLFECFKLFDSHMRKTICISNICNYDRFSKIHRFTICHIHTFMNSMNSLTLDLELIYMYICYIIHDVSLNCFRVLSDCTKLIWVSLIH